MLTATRACCAILIAAAMLCACHSRPAPSAIPLTKMGGEPPGYPGYTYVFFGSPEIKLPPEIKERQIARNRALIAALAAAGPISPQPATVFCFPAKSGDAPAAIAADNYNAEVAAQYRSLVALRFPGTHMGKLTLMRFTADAGPFLITTLTPLSRSVNQGPMLYTELTRLEPHQLSGVIQKYREINRVEAGDSPSDEDFLRRLAQAMKQNQIDASVWVKN